MVDAAAEAGAQALKLQTYTADTMTLDIRHGDFFISDPNSLWKGKSSPYFFNKLHPKTIRKSRSNNHFCKKFNKQTIRKSRSSHNFCNGHQLL